MSKALHKKLIRRLSPAVSPSPGADAGSAAKPPGPGGRSQRVSSLDARSVAGEQPALPVDAAYELAPARAVVHLRDLLRLSTALADIAVLGNHGGGTMPRGYASRGTSRSSLSRLGTRGGARTTAPEPAAADGSSLAGVAHVALCALWSLLRVDASVQRAIASATEINAAAMDTIHEVLTPAAVLSPISAVLVARHVPLALYHLASVNASSDFDRTALLALRLLHVLHSGSSAAAPSTIPRHPPPAAAAAHDAPPLIGALVLAQIEHAIGHGAYEQLLLSFLEAPASEAVEHAAALLAMAACRASRPRINIPGVDGVRRLCAVLSSSRDPRVVTHVLYSLLALSVDARNQHDIAHHAADVVLELLRIAPQVAQHHPSHQGGRDATGPTSAAVATACVTAAKLFFNLSRNGANRSVLYKAELRQHTAAFRRDTAQAATALGIRLPALLPAGHPAAADVQPLELTPLPVWAPGSSTFMTEELGAAVRRDREDSPPQSGWGASTRGSQLQAQQALGATAVAAASQLVSQQRVALTALKTLRGDTVVIPGPSPSPAEASLVATMTGSQLQSYVQSAAVVAARGRPPQSLPPRTEPSPSSTKKSSRASQRLQPLTSPAAQSSRRSTTALTVTLATDGAVERGDASLLQLAQSPTRGAVDRPRTGLMAQLTGGAGASSGGLYSSASAPSLGGTAPLSRTFVGSSRAEPVVGGELQTRMAVSTLKSAGKAAVVIREATRLTAPTYYAEQDAAPGASVPSHLDASGAPAPDRWNPDVVACDAATAADGSAVAPDKLRSQFGRRASLAAAEAPPVGGAADAAYLGVDAWAAQLRSSVGVGLVDDEDPEAGPSDFSLLVQQQGSGTPAAASGGAGDGAGSSSHDGGVTGEGSVASAMPLHPAGPRPDAPFSVSLRGPDRTTRPYTFHADRIGQPGGRGLHAAWPLRSGTSSSSVDAAVAAAAVSARGLGGSTGGAAQLPGSRGKAAEADASLLSLSDKATLDLLAAALARARGAPAASVRQVRVTTQQWRSLGEYVRRRSSSASTAVGCSDCALPLPFISSAGVEGRGRGAAAGGAADDRREHQQQRLAGQDRRFWCAHVVFCSRRTPDTLLSVSLCPAAASSSAHASSGSASLKASSSRDDSMHHTVGVAAFPHTEGASLCAGIPHIELPDGRSVHVYQSTRLYDAIVPSDTRPPSPPLGVTDLHPFASSILQPVQPLPQVPPVQDVAAQLELAISTALMQPQPPPSAIPASMCDASESTLECVTATHRAHKSRMHRAPPPVPSPCAATRTACASP